MPHANHRLDATKRDAAGDLLFAFVWCGWEALGMPLTEAIEAADYLAWDDPALARRLARSLIRGEAMAPDIVAWLGSAAANAKTAAAPSGRGG